MSTRRHFLALSSAAAAVSAFPGTLLAQFPAEVFSNANLGAYAQGLLTQSHFQSQVGSVFKAFLPDRSVSYLTLLEVRDRTPGSTVTTASTNSPSHVAMLRRGTTPVADSQCFDLAFSVSGPALEQESYTLDHGILGRFAAFLVPGTSAGGGNTCGASFNYVASTSLAPVTVRGRVPSPITGAPISAAPVSGAPILAAPVLTSPGEAPGAEAGAANSLTAVPAGRGLRLALPQ